VVAGVLLVVATGLLVVTRRFQVMSAADDARDVAQEANAVGDPDA
jgi:hypothetical protein